MSDILSITKEIQIAAAQNGRLTVVAAVMQWLLDNRESVSEPAQTLLLKILDEVAE